MAQNRNEAGGMKAPGFWYQREGLTSQLLSPLSYIFHAGTQIRHTLARPYKAKIPVICVGNVVAGGAGKTPTALAIAEILKQNGAKPVFVVRGYGGKECGPLQVDPARHTSIDVGDEALLLAQMAPAWIGRDRAAAIRAAEDHGTHIILDDGLQNPNIKPDISFLVIDGESGIGNGKIIPAGPLRETFESALERITAVILIGNDTHTIATHVSKPVLHARLEPALPVNFSRDKKFLAFAGIGRPEKFYKTCRDASLNLIGTKDFADHHTFTDDEITWLRQIAAQQNAALLTTEKDRIRMRNDQRAEIATLPVKLIFDSPDQLSRLVSEI